METVSRERLWLTADRERVVRDGDPEAAYLLVGRGCPVDEEMQVRYGIPTVRVHEGVEDKAIPGPRERRLRVS